MTVRQEFKNLESSVVVQMHEFAVNRVLYGLLRHLSNQYNVRSLSWLSLTLTVNSMAEW